MINPRSSDKQPQKKLKLMSPAEANDDNMTNEEDRHLIEDAQSRAAAAWGREAMMKLKNASYLVSGMGGTGVEAAKNILLTRIKNVIIHDTKATTWSDLSSQFYLTEADVGKNRAEASFPKLQELNPAVNTTVATNPILDVIASATALDTVVLCDHTHSEIQAVNKLCREKGIKLVVGVARGVFGMIFCDYGPEFVCHDNNGEEFKELPVVFADKDGSVQISTEDGIGVHGLEDGDTVIFSRLEGTNGIEKLNGQERKVTVKSYCSFNVGSLEEFGDFDVHTGFVQGLKKPIKHKFKPFEEALSSPGEFVAFDLMKFTSAPNLHMGFQALSAYESKHGSLPAPGDQAAAAEIVATTEEIFKNKPNFEGLIMPVEEVDKAQISKLALYSAGKLNPVASIIGGIIAQEAQKSVTGKYTPMKQFLYVDFAEAVPDTPLDQAELAPQQCRYDGQIAVFGRKAQETIINKKVFMVGCGALGCEYLKNFACVGLACGEQGDLVVTDMDNIETSNLNRQFLFRAQHVGKMKAQIGTAAAQAMNPGMKPKAMNEMVAPSTENVFPPSFWEGRDLIVNALDNIQARLYVDQQCVRYHKPLVEAGTEATKANTVMVVPDFTVNYGFTRELNPPAAKSCTIKNFPYLIDHCIQWARENVFEGHFSTDIDAAAKYIQNSNFFKSFGPNDRDQAIHAIDRVIGGEATKTFEDCVRWARQLFQDMYHNEPLNWQTAYPADTKTSTGALFWSGTKHFPQVQEFNATDDLHMQFMATGVALRAKALGIATPFQRMDSAEAKAAIAKICETVTLKPFAPKKVKVEADAGDVPTTATHEETFGEEPDDILKRLPAVAEVKQWAKPTPEEFEKDDDSNYHVDFVMAASNLRANMYSIAPADRLKTKLFAGKVIAAIVTTTAVITGYAMMEILKQLAGLPNSAIRQVTVNLGVNMFSMEEPLPAPTWKYGPEGKQYEFNLWKVIETDVRHIKIKDYIASLQENYGLEVYALSIGVKSVWNTLLPALKKNGELTFVEWCAKKEVKIPPEGKCEIAVNAYDGTTYYDEEMFMETENEPENLPTFIIKIV